MTALLLALPGAAGTGLLFLGLIAEHLRPPSGPARTAPALDTCAAPGCPRPVRRGETWCGWLCRNEDDRHDDTYLYGWGDDD